MKPEIRQRIEEMLDAGGELTTEQILAEARKKTSPLHEAFEWDAKKAHNIYLMDRARSLIREYWIEVNSGNELVRIRGSVSLPTPEDFDGPRRAYYSTRAVLSDADLRSRMLDQALRELSAFRRKYATLSELATVFAVIDKAIPSEEEAA